MSAPTIIIDDIEWEIQEVTRDSMVVTDLINDKQTVAFRLVCERKIQP